MIPARYDASRFPGKLMQKLGDKTVIRRVYEASLQTGLFDDVIVVTDSSVIEEEIQAVNGHVIRSKKEHESGSDRIAEAAAGLDVDIILNVQGDTPFIKKAPLEKLLKLFDDETVQVASLMQIISDEKVISDPNRVKVCVDKKNNSLLFSRSIIPYPRKRKTYQGQSAHPAWIRRLPVAQNSFEMVTEKAVLPTFRQALKESSDEEWTAFKKGHGIAPLEKPDRERLFADASGLVRNTGFEEWVLGIETKSKGIEK